MTPKEKKAFVKKMKKAKEAKAKERKKQSKKSKAPSSKRSLEKVQREVEGMTKLKGHEPLYGEESGGILQHDNSWHVLIDGKEYVVHLDPAYFKKYGYSIDAELDFFFSAMHDVGLSSDNMADMSKMNNTLNPKFKEYKSR